MKDDRYEHIWRIRDECQATQRIKDSLNNSIQTLAEDLYSKDTHFIFELIQNAEDNTYSSVEPSLSFRLVKDDPTGTKNSVGALIVQNNEIGFSPEDVEAICNVRKTTKKKIQGYIGEKGIGFKSVFRITSNPHIYSNGYNFCLPEHDEETGLGYIVPKWLDQIPEAIAPSQTTIVLPLDKEGFGYAKIAKMLRDIEPETIIFLSKLKEIAIQTGTEEVLTILKDDQNIPQIQIMIEGTIHWRGISQLDTFLLYRKDFDRPVDVSHDKRHGINKRDVSIAFPLSADQKKIGKIFAYLPVRSDTGFPFLINADFILTSSREEILDNTWNRWLMKCVGELMGPALALLSDKGALTIGFLEALAKRLLATTETDIFYPIALGAKKAFNDMPLLPAADGTTVKAQLAKIARGSELRNLVGHDQLKMLFQSSHDIKWLSAEITEGTSDLWRYLTAQLGVEVVRPEKFLEFLTDDFLEKQSDEWIIEFYSLLDKDWVQTWKRSDTLIRKRKLIRLEDNSHVVAFKIDGTPNAYLPTAARTTFQTVKRTISENENAKKFLKKLGIFEPDIFAEIIESILPKYAVDRINVSKQDNIEDLWKIKRLLDEPFRGNVANSLSKLRILSNRTPAMADFLAKLEELSEDTDENDERSVDFFRRCVPAFLKASLPSIPLARASNGRGTEYKPAEGVYQNNSELAEYFRWNFDAWFVCEDYPDEILSLLYELGINKSPVVGRRSPDENGFVIISQSRGHNKRGLSGFDPDIVVDGLEKAIASPNMKKSMFIWNDIALPHKDCIQGIVENSKKKSYENSTTRHQVSRFGRTLIENAWLPSPNGDFSKPKDLFLSDLPTGFKRDDQLAKALGMKLQEIQQALDLITGGDADLKMLIEHYQSATDADRKRILQAIPREIKKEPSPSFKQGLENLARSQRGVIDHAKRPMPQVSNPDRYQDKLNERVEEGIREDRSSMRKISFSLVRNVASNSEARRFLYEQYAGRCQIFGTTFPKAHSNLNGLSENYFEACSLLSYANADYLNDPGNMLCVSADTMAKLKFASFEFVDNLEDAIEKFKADGEAAESVSVRIRLAGAECEIKWNQRHFMRLIALYDKA